MTAGGMIFESMTFDGMNADPQLAFVVGLAALACCVAWPAVELLRQSQAWRALRAMRAGPSARAPARLSAHTPAGDTADGTTPARFAHVDVLQPIRSGDPSLGEALASSLRTLAAHGARLHWLIDEDDRPAADAVQSALASVPTVAASVAVRVLPPCPHGLNPKLFKLDRALADCRGDIVLILDDDARLPAASLDALLASLVIDEAAAQQAPLPPIIATALPIYLQAPGFGSRLLARFVNDHAAITYLPPRLTRSPTINGMCWAMRRDALLAIGGFAPRLGHLTDDLAMARAVLAAGGRIEQRREPVWLRTVLPGVLAYVRQMHRWMLFGTLLVRSEPWPSRWRIVIGQGLASLLPALATLALVLAPNTATLSGWCVGALLHIVGRHELQRASASAVSRLQPITSLLVALSMPLHLLHALLVRRIRWRAHRYRVFDNDRFTELG
jgi:ceramide glucosyltransferase